MITAHPLPKNTPFIKYEPDWDDGRDYIFKQKSAMTLTLEIRLKVTAHSLPKSTLCVKYEAYKLDKGIENVFQTTYVIWTCGWTDTIGGSQNRVLGDICHK